MDIKMEETVFIYLGFVLFWIGSYYIAQDDLELKKSSYLSLPKY